VTGRGAKSTWFTTSRASSYERSRFRIEPLRTQRFSSDAGMHSSPASLESIRPPRATTHSLRQPWTSRPCGVVEK
jgi:hypothetical protein